MKFMLEVELGQRMNSLNFGVDPAQQAFYWFLFSSVSLITASDGSYGSNGSRFCLHMCSIVYILVIILLSFAKYLS